MQLQYLPSVCDDSDDLQGSKLLATITQAGSTNNIGPFCLDKLAATDVVGRLYCRTSYEIFPWIKLEFQEEVIFKTKR